MPRSQMLIAVAASTALCTLNILAGKHLYTRALYAFDPDLMSDEPDEPWKDYCMKKLPREVLCTALINVLRYYWYIFLERMLPTRPRPKLETSHKRSSSIDNEVEEEKIISDWIAQGRIRRSTISWCNIFAKVLLDITVANLFLTAVAEILERVIRLKKPRSFFEDLWLTILISAVGQLFSPTPALSLLAFIVSPAHQRIVFEDAVYLAFTVFFALFLGKLGPWIMSNEFFRESYRNGTQAAREALLNGTTLANQTKEEL